MNTCPPSCPGGTGTYADARTPNVYADLTRDAGFKTVLASKTNKDLLIGILNHILPPEKKVGDIVEYLDKERVTSVISSKVSFFDLI